MSDDEDKVPDYGFGAELPTSTEEFTDEEIERLESAANMLLASGQCMTMTDARRRVIEMHRMAKHAVRRSASRSASEMLASMVEMVEGDETPPWLATDAAWPGTGDVIVCVKHNSTDPCRECQYAAHVARKKGEVEQKQLTAKFSVNPRSRRLKATRQPLRQGSDPLDQSELEALVSMLLDRMGGDATFTPRDQREWQRRIELVRLGIETFRVMDTANLDIRFLSEDNLYKGPSTLPSASPPTSPHRAPLTGGEEDEDLPF